MLLFVTIITNPCQQLNELAKYRSPYRKRYCFIYLFPSVYNDSFKERNIFR